MSNIEILIVDDVSTTRELLRGLIVSIANALSKPIKAHIHQAATASETSNILGKQNISLVFLDIDLPDGSGLDLIDEVKTNRPNAAIIMVSGDSSIDSVKQAIAKGVSGYIVKPFNKARVQEAIEKGLESISHAT